MQPSSNQLLHTNTRQHGTMSPFEAICAFQAYLIYLLMTYFFPIEGTPLVSDTRIMALFRIAYETAGMALTCPVEDDCGCPRLIWETWILASASRRTLLTLYLFTKVYSVENGQPDFVAEEQIDVFVLDSKVLWEAGSRAAWESEYSKHLLNWEDGMLRISELLVSPETRSEEQRKRIERWVMGADEFGMMLFAVCAHAHRC